MLGNVLNNARPLILAGFARNETNGLFNILPAVTGNATTNIDTTNTITSIPVSAADIPQCLEHCCCGCHKDCDCSGIAIANTVAPDSIRKRKRHNNPVNEIKRAMHRKTLKNNEITFPKESDLTTQPSSSSPLKLPPITSWPEI
jgi:hypothetical protein